MRNTAAEYEALNGIAATRELTKSSSETKFAGTGDQPADLRNWIWRCRQI